MGKMVQVPFLADGVADPGPKGRRFLGRASGVLPTGRWQGRASRRSRIWPRLAGSGRSSTPRQGDDHVDAEATYARLKDRPCRFCRRLRQIPGTSLARDEKRSATPQLGGGEQERAEPHARERGWHADRHSVEPRRPAFSTGNAGFLEVTLNSFSGIIGTIYAFGDGEN